MTSKSARNHLRNLYAAQQGVCAGCGRRMLGWIKHTNFAPCVRIPTRPTLDHIWPRSRGGSDALLNLLAKHWACNVARSDAKPTGCDLIWAQAVRARLNLPALDPRKPEWPLRDRSEHESYAATLRRWKDRRRGRAAA